MYHTAVFNFPHMILECEKRVLICLCTENFAIVGNFPYPLSLI